jgi:hypothetical protein
MCFMTVQIENAGKNPDSTGKCNTAAFGKKLFRNNEIAQTAHHSPVCARTRLRV